MTSTASALRSRRSEAIKRGIGSTRLTGSLHARRNYPSRSLPVRITANVNRYKPDRFNAELNLVLWVGLLATAVLLLGR
jgi:hypothetical protein